VGSKVASLISSSSQGLGGYQFHFSRLGTNLRRIVEQVHGTFPSVYWVWDSEQESLAVNRWNSMF